MVLKSILISFVVSGVVCWSAEASEIAEYNYTITTAVDRIQINGGRVIFVGDSSGSTSGLFHIPYRQLKLILPPHTEIERLEIMAKNPLTIARNLSLQPVSPDIKTGISQGRDATAASSDTAYRTRAKLIGSGYWENIHVAELAVFPVEYLTSGDLVLYPEIAVRFILKPRNALLTADGNSNILAYDILTETAANASQLAQFGYSRSMGDLITGGVNPELLLITTRAFEPHFQPYILWKNQKGVRADAALIEDILESEHGIDPPEQLRNFLIEAHSGGTQWVILGGDEDNIPIRYLFAGNAESAPPPLSIQQISDLYYSDLTGNWDFDGDGIWGETVHDRPDIYPEIYVGRVPARDTVQVDNWVSNAIAYEKNPGNGDPAYLTKALISCADEMRDLDQHISLRGLFPDNFDVDNVRLIEEPAGWSESPSQPWGESVIEVMNEGWGYITGLNHGDLAFFVSQSSGYNSYNLSEVWGDTLNFEHDGSMSHLTTLDRPGIFYSVSCDVAAFDFDKGIFNAGPWITTRCLAESYLFQPGGGTAFLGNTRWGWVGSSFRLENYFLQRALADSTNHLGVAEALSKIDYPIYYDIVYGHNLFGDPETEMWSKVDGQLHIDGPGKAFDGREQTLHFRIWDKSGPVIHARLCLYLQNQVFAIGYSNSSGIVELNINPDSAGVMTATVTKPGYLVSQYEIIVGTPTGIEDSAPVSISPALIQNYPNPFNSSTTIGFELSQHLSVQIVIYDLGGRKVKTLISDMFEPGRYNIVWDGTDDDGQAVSSGAYFYRLDAGVSIVKQMMLVK